MGGFSSHEDRVKNYRDWASRDDDTARKKLEEQGMNVDDDTAREHWRRTADWIEHLDRRNRERKENR